MGVGRFGTICLIGLLLLAIPFLCDVLIIFETSSLSAVPFTGMVLIFLLLLSLELLFFAFGYIDPRLTSKVVFILLLVVFGTWLREGVSIYNLVMLIVMVGGIISGSQLKNGLEI